MQYFRHEMLYQKCSFCLNMTLLIEILNKRIARTEYLSAYFVKKQNENGHIYLMIINMTVFHNERFVLSLSLFLINLQLNHDRLLSFPFYFVHTSKQVRF